MYTKGEWIADNGDSELWGIFQKEDCQGIAYLCEPDGTLLRENEAEANAHLIASAPLLYEALQRAIRLLELAEASPHKVKWGTRYDCLTPPETIIELKQALAKAEGK